MLNKENDEIAKAFCSHKDCSFTPQTVYASTFGPGGDVEWLLGRKYHHDKIHDHEATVVILPRIEQPSVI